MVNRQRKKDWNVLVTSCAATKGANWALANCSDIPFANDAQLWGKVENTWQPEEGL